MRNVVSNPSYESENFVMENFEKEYVTHAYHVYKEIWKVAIGKEPDISYQCTDWYTVAVVNSGIVVGH